MKSFSAAKLLVVLWIVFSILYIVGNEWARLKTFVYDRGRMETISQVIQFAKKCQPFPVNVGDERTTLISVECLQQSAAPAPEKK